MPITPLGFLDFKREMAFDLHWGDLETISARESDILDRLIQSAVRKVFFPIQPGTAHVHQWSWTNPLRSLIVRGQITGALAIIPTRAGDIYTFIATADIFDSDVVGLDLTFDDSGQRYTIVEHMDGSTIRVIGSERSEFGQATELGERQVATVNSASLVFPDVVSTIITETAARDFHADFAQIFNGMEGDKMVVGSNEYEVLSVDESNNQIRVLGDASAETASMTIRKWLNPGLILSADTVILLGASRFRQDMADNSDTIQFIAADETVDPTVYTIVGLNSLLSVDVDLDSSGEDNSGGLNVYSSFGTDYTAAAAINQTTVVVEEENTFVASDVGQLLAFIGPRLGQGLGTYEILDVVGGTNGTTVVVSGDATVETVSDVSVVRGAGELDTTARTFNGTTTLLTVTSTSTAFTSAMVGLVVEFPVRRFPPPFDNGTKYVITEVVSTTSVRVAGDASAEGPPWDGYLILGPSDLAAGDTFTLLNTGAFYELPEDFGGLDGPITFTTTDYSLAVTVVTEAMVRRAQQRDDSNGRPQIAAIRPVVHDGKFTQRYDILMWPTPDGKYTLNYRQIVVLPEIDEVNLFPPGGAAYGELYMAACLALATQRINDRRGLRWDEFQERLAAMIEVDAIATSAENLGKGFEEGRQGVRLVPQRGTVTYVPGN